VYTSLKKELEVIVKALWASSHRFGNKPRDDEQVRSHPGRQIGVVPDENG